MNKLVTEHAYNRASIIKDNFGFWDDFYFFNLMNHLINFMIKWLINSGNFKSIQEFFWFSLVMNKFLIPLKQNAVGFESFPYNQSQVMCSSIEQWYRLFLALKPGTDIPYLETSDFVLLLLGCRLLIRLQFKRVNFCSGIVISWHFPSWNSDSLVPLSVF